ncbi:MAG TPA: LysR family transcriptional regulator [Rhizomicrobium sp.]|jgi:DNA-binding transcriptional LysR family regulator
MIYSMREVNISGLDLNLIPPLDALLRLRNVTKAAADTGMSQPAMSRALARLRDLQNDPLLVRAGRGYVLTPRAEAIQPDVTRAIAHLRAIYRHESFDPRAVQRMVRFAAADTHTVLLVPRLMARLAKEAPGVALRGETYRPDSFARLESGELDFAFALANTPLPPGAYSEPVLRDRLALVMRKGHPAARRKWRIADYGRYGHAGVAMTGDGQSEIDTLLAAHGVTRRIALVTPHFTAALAAVAASDLVTTISAAFARRFARAFDLALHEPPFGDTVLETTFVCSHIRATDPFLAWLRTLVREVGDSIGLARAGGRG